MQEAPRPIHVAHPMQLLDQSYGDSQGLTG
jgi:hypothetical protein